MTEPYLKKGYPFITESSSHDLYTRKQVAELMRGMVPAAYTATDYLKGYVDDAEATGHNDFRTETLARIEAWQNQGEGK